MVHSLAELSSAHVNELRATFGGEIILPHEEAYDDARRPDDARACTGRDALFEMSADSGWDDPALDEAGIGNKLEHYDPRYYSTYYAIDAINFEPVKSPAVMDTIDGPYLPLVIQEAAGIPLDPSFEEQKSIMLRCKGVFYACKDGAEARRFNRLLIDAGFVKNL